MASSNRNVIAHGLSGKVGDLVIFTQRYGRTFMGKIPVRSRKASPNQEAVREKFVKAISYAKRILRDLAYKTLYQQRAGGGLTPFNLAVADFFTPPVIGEVDISAYTGAAGSKIKVQATDDTKVIEVTVSISAADGTVIEQGAAVPDPDHGTWVYTATANNASPAGSKINVVAKDPPGNSATAEKLL
jgi:hypothetical protein